MECPVEDFPWFEKSVGPFCSRFCENFELFIHSVACEVQSKPTNISRAWNLPLLYRQSHITLRIYEEPTTLAHPNCEQCRCNGWQHHPVSRTKVHFILPSATSEFVFESKMHVLHGIIHLNGFGHLMRINGLEGGSEYLRGTQLMLLWDALCRLLCVRSITVEDVSNRKGMQLRLLLPIARKTTFYMRHGYEFGRGQFGVQKETWLKAVDDLHNTSLLDLLSDFAGVDETIQRIILRYQGHGEDRMMTLGALLDSMLMLTENEYCALQFCVHLLSRNEPTSEELSAFASNHHQQPPQPLNIRVEVPNVNGHYGNGVDKDCDSDQAMMMDITPGGSSIVMNSTPTTTTTTTTTSAAAAAAALDHKPSNSGRLTNSQESLSPMQEDDDESDHDDEEEDGEDSQTNNHHHSLHSVKDEDIILKTPRKYKKRIPLEDPGDLVKPRIAPFNAASLFEGSRKYSATKMLEIIRITLGVLQCYENRWVRLQELRDILYDTAHDRVLADFVLGRMANSTVNGFSIFKQRSKIARCNYYLFEKYEGADRAQYREAFLDQIEDTCNSEQTTPTISATTLLSPGPEHVNGHSLDRFEEYLGLLFKWMCNQPNVSIGRGPNKNKPRPKPKRKEPESEKDLIPSRYPVRNARLTRAHTSALPKKNRIIGTPKDEPHIVKLPWMERYPSEVAGSLEEFRSSGTRPGSRFSARKNVLVDLLYLYQSMIETYRPLTDGPKSSLSSSSLKLTEFAKNIQVLKDTKFFVKDYTQEVKTENSSQLPCLAATNGHCPRMDDKIGLVCRVHLDPTIPPCHLNERMQNEMPSFLSAAPPTEKVYVPVGANVVTIRHAVEDAFSKIYTMFEMWNVGEMSNLKLENQILQSASETVIEVKGNIFHQELELRHSGGIEDWEVLCLCGTRDDDGARMLCCDICSVWMHTRCAGFRDDADVPSFFQCPHCSRKNSH